MSGKERMHYQINRGTKYLYKLRICSNLNILFTFELKLYHDKVTMNDGMVPIDTIR